MFEYRGYRCDFHYDKDDSIWYGKIAGIRDLVNFESDTYDGLSYEFYRAVDDYLTCCKKVGKEPDKPKCCGTCVWYAAFEGVCTNGLSKYRAGFRYAGDRCREWEENQSERN